MTGRTELHNCQGNVIGLHYRNVSLSLLIVVPYARWHGNASTFQDDNVMSYDVVFPQRKRWENSIREWTGLEFGKSQRAVENKEKWRKLVAESSVVPQRPSRLRD